MNSFLSRPSWTRSSFAPRVVYAVLTTLVLASCRDPRAEANIAEAMIQVGTEISAMRQDYALLQNQVDSLRGVVARQDSILARLATVANVK
jgi:hypothetical protein